MSSQCLAARSHLERSCLGVELWRGLFVQRCIVVMRTKGGEVDISKGKKYPGKLAQGSVLQVAAAGQKTTVQQGMAQWSGQKRNRTQDSTAVGRGAPKHLQEAGAILGSQEPSVSRQGVDGFAGKALSQPAPMPLNVARLWKMVDDFMVNAMAEDALKPIDQQIMEHPAVEGMDHDLLTYLRRSAPDLINAKPHFNVVDLVMVARHRGQSGIRALEMVTNSYKHHEAPLNLHRLAAMTILFQPHGNKLLGAALSYASTLLDPSGEYRLDSRLFVDTLCLNEGELKLHAIVKDWPTLTNMNGSHRMTGGQVMEMVRPRNGHLRLEAFREALPSLLKKLGDSQPTRETAKRIVSKKDGHIVLRLVAEVLANEDGKYNVNPDSVLLIAQGTYALQTMKAFMAAPSAALSGA